MRLRRQRWSLRHRRFSLLGAAFKLIAAQQAQLEAADQVVVAMRDQADSEIADLQRLILECHRATRDVAVVARLAAMQGADILDDLDALISDLSDSIANLEEHLVAR